MTQRTTVAGYLITRLAQVGVRHLFAVPGDYASPFLLAVDASPDVERVANINELGSGYAADGYARFRGVGAACVQYGVGTFSLLNCTAASFVERVPVVVISASPATADRRLARQKQILFHHSTGELRADQRIFRRVTVASEILRAGWQAPEQIDRALTQLLTHRRPVYLECLNDAWNEVCRPPAGELAPRPPASDTGSLRAAAAAAWDRIRAARLPVLWVGVEVQRFGLQDLVQQLVDASGLPFATTSLGKTTLDERQPQFIGTYAGPASPPLTRQVMDACDCPVALGTIITDDYLGIMATRFDQMVEATADGMRVGHQYYQQVALPDFLRALLDHVRAGSNGPRSIPLPPAPTEDVEPAGDDDPLTYGRFSAALAAFLASETADNSVLVLGESTSLYVLGNLMGLPRNGFVAQAAWGSLGHETGCALGVALGSGKRPFVVAGDGGFMMVCQELSSLVRAKCNAVVFVLSNRAYAIEQAFVDLAAFSPGGSYAAFDLLPAWDYLALAKAFGANGYRAERAGELRQILRDVSRLTDVPALVEVVIPAEDLPPQLRRLATP